MDAEELIVLVKWDPEDLAFEVVDEADFVSMMTADTDTFYPHVKRSLLVINGERFTGYKWFTTNIDGLAADKDNSVANYLADAAMNLTGYNFRRGQSYEEHEPRDLFQFMGANALNPEVLRNVEIQGFATERPFNVSASSNGISALLAAARKPETQQEADPWNTDPNPSTDPRPLWLL